MLLGRVPEVEAGIGSDKFGMPSSFPLRRLGNLPSIHLEFEELELDRRELDKQEVEQPEVDKLDLAEPGVGKARCLIKFPRCRNAGDDFSYQEVKLSPYLSNSSKPGRDSGGANMSEELLVLNEVKQTVLKTSKLSAVIFRGTMMHPRKPREGAFKQLSHSGRPGVVVYEDYEDLRDRVVHT
ncbi:hypothetical protein Tco_0791983 [Tanacetum coccineum]